MVAFIVKRVIQACIVMVIVSCIAFAVKYSFGDPTRDMLGMSASAEARAELRTQLGLDKPVFEQWIVFVGNVLRGNLGDSYFYREPAMDVILSRLPATVELVCMATLIIVCVAIPAGVYVACNPSSLISKTIMLISMLGVSIPVFLTSMFLIYVFSIQLNLFPSFGRGEPVEILGFWTTNFTTFSNFLHILLPSLALSSIMFPLFVRITRSDMKEALTSEYVRYAQAKGLSRKRIVWRHAFRNTLLPLVTIGGVQVGTMVAFTILTESVFQWQGLGYMFIEAVSRADTGLLVAYLLFTSFIFVTINTLVDIIYTFIDPTITIKGN
ncbi:MAG: ABC transporter permease [Desulfovibrionaceae bacterium]|nr:ABC transporter permease [Desulfovibrionaceae bacterium]